MNKATGVTTGGMPDIQNDITYKDVLPSFDAHYQLQPNWSTYFQAAQGDLIPPTGVFDVPFAKVAQPPKAQKSNTYQVGTVYQDTTGKRIPGHFTGFDARVYQHEYDHLVGTLFVEHATKFYRPRVATAK